MQIPRLTTLQVREANGAHGRELPSLRLSLRQRRYPKSHCEARVRSLCQGGAEVWQPRTLGVLTRGAASAVVSSEVGVSRHPLEHYQVIKNEAKEQVVPRNGTVLNQELGQV